MELKNSVLSSTLLKLLSWLLVLVGFMCNLLICSGKKTVLTDESGKPTVANSVKVTLSFDGRVIDEVAASTFLEKVSQYLGNPSVLV